MLKDDVAAASGDVAVEIGPRSSISSEIRPIWPASKSVSPSWSRDIFALVGEEQHAATEDGSDHHAGDADENAGRALSVDRGRRACDVSPAKGVSEVRCLVSPIRDPGGNASGFVRVSGQGSSPNMGCR